MATAVVRRCLSVARPVSLIGVPFRKGQKRNGVELGPCAIRKGGLLETLRRLNIPVVDEGDISIDPFGFPADCAASPLKNAPEVSSACYQLSEKVITLAKDDRFSLILGGDHSLSLGSINGLVYNWKDLRVVWVDAHVDLNSPESSTTGNAHGMSALLNLKTQKSPPGFEWLETKVPEENLVYIGIREIDPGEWMNIQSTRVKVFTMRDVDKLGISKVMEITKDHLKTDAGHPVHVSFDVDSFDPSVMACTGTKVPGGLTLREGLFIAETLAKTNLVGMDVVEFNPQLGSEEEQRRALQTINTLIATILTGNRTKIPFNC